MRGLFVTLEGPDGSGKSTVLNGLKEKLNERGINAIFTREPGGTPIAEKIRELILDNSNDKMTDRCEALLYAASRAQHTEELIMPNIEKGNLVISDRYVMSSLAYQGHGRGLGVSEVSKINDFATNHMKPDIVLFLDVDPVKVLERKAKEVQQDRLEKAGNDFHTKVYEGYLEALKFAKNVHRIDANQSKEEVINQAWAIIFQAWEERK